MTTSTLRPIPPEAAERLQESLKRTIRGEVRFDRLHRTLYSTDASIYEITPAGVVMPRDVDDCCAIVNACREQGVPMIARGAGTGLTGGAVGNGLLIDLSRHMNAVVELDVAARRVRVQPGVVLDELNARLAPHGLQFAPDVATSSRATVGGMIANNSSGAHSVIYGRTIDHVAELKLVLADGSIVTWREGQAPRAETELQRRVIAELERMRVECREEVERRFPKVLRRNGGYMLDRICEQADGPLNLVPIICGSEGTLALVVEAVLKLVPLPSHKGLLVVHFQKILDSLSATPRILEHQPAAVELVDDMILRAAFASQALSGSRALIDGDPEGILGVEFYDDTPEAVERRIDALEADLRSAGIGYAWRKCLSAAEQNAIWSIRKAGLGLMMSRPGDEQYYSFIEDACVHPTRLRDYIARLVELVRGEGITDIGYYAHASVGVLHVKPILNLRKQADVERMQRIAEGVSTLVLEFGGSMTGEHGDGIIRSVFTEKMYGPALYQAFRQIKAAFDPDGLFNPGKIVDPLKMTENLRYGPSFQTVQLKESLDFSTHGGLAGLVNMCSGVGECRKRLVGTMCPSYMATDDELHTTRARANALRLALSNRGLIEGLDDPVLEEVMDLCISCKACKTECPTGVDMARIKSEWLSQKNMRHGVPPHARMVAQTPRLARMGSRFAPFSNWIAQSGVVRAYMERKHGFDRRIPPPRFARQTFRHWMRRHRKSGAALKDGPRGRVLYFVDTWTNYYEPATGIAAVRLLEAAGYEVLTPVLHCCGRPAIGKGLLTEVRLAAQMNVETLAPHIDRRTPMVGTEPSCILTFVDEYPQLVRTDDARALAEQCFTLESFLARLLRTEPTALRFMPPTAPLLYHGHCHQKAIVGTADANALLRMAYGDAAREINSGCCGMAGSFGYELGHYEVSKAMGEQRLFPAVRSRSDAHIAVSGFSCRHQIEHHCGATVRHAVEFLADLLA